MIGTKVGKWTIIKEVQKSNDNKRQFECHCDCGNIKNVRLKDLKNFKSTSCGCQKGRRKGSLNSSDSSFIFNSSLTDLISKRIGKLFILNIVKEGKSRIAFNALCDCGKIKEIDAYAFKYGKIKSCGCLRGRDSKELTESERIKTRNFPEYSLWRKSIFEKDKFICQSCFNVKNNKLCAHHIISYSKNENLRTALSNGVTMCKKCHVIFHKLYGKNNADKDDLIEFNFLLNI